MANEAFSAYTTGLPAKASPLSGNEKIAVVDGSTAKSVTVSQIASISAAYAAAVLADSPTQFLRFNETSGTTASDSSGNNHTGTYNVGNGAVGGPTFVMDSLGGSFFTGTTGWISTSTLPATSAFSVELVFRSNNHNNFGRLIGTDVYNASRGFLITLSQYATNPDLIPNSYNLTFNTSGGSVSNQNVAVGAVSAGKNQVALTFDGTSVKLYSNGVVVYSTSLSGTYLPSTTYSILGIGQDPSTPTSNNFNGNIAEYALYPSALSSTRIRAHAQAMGL